MLTTFALCSLGGSERNPVELTSVHDWIFIASISVYLSLPETKSGMGAPLVKYMSCKAKYNTHIIA